MRKWYMVVIVLMTVIGLLTMLGCEGDGGKGGGIGDDGPKGDSGIDLSRLQPEDRQIAVGLTNGTFNAVNGVTSLRLTFDSTAIGRSDLVAARRVSSPPLIDGSDDGDAVWGSGSSRLRLTLLNPDPDIQDPSIYDLQMKAAFDDENIYFFFKWKEKAITVRTPEGNDTTLVDAVSSVAVSELFHDRVRKIIEDIDESEDDTTFFQWLRLDTIAVETTYVCIGELCFVDQINAIADTNLVWRTWREGEDRLVMFFDDNDNQIANWADLAFAEFFDFSGGANLPPDFMVDVWAWGAGTTAPVFIADDWAITAAGKAPDLGQPPYLTNFSMPDSVPIYMHYRDPNYKSTINLETNLFPFWYYDAAGYAVNDWFINRAVFVAGIVTTIPTGSRADVYAASSFDTPSEWTLEFKRARRTNNGEDVEF